MTDALTAADDRLMFCAVVVYAFALLGFAAQAAFGRGQSAQTGGGTEVTDLVAPALVGGRLPATGAPTTDPAPPPAASTRATRAGLPAARAARTALLLTQVATALLAAAVLARAVEAGRAPWGNMYEYATGVALAAAVAFLVMARRRTVLALGTWVIGAVLLTLGLAVTVLYAPADELVPALNSYWLVIHVAAAIVAGGVFTVGAGASLLFFVRVRAESRNPSLRSTRGLPTATALDKVTYSAIVFAFPVWTFAVIAGAIWAEEAWGRYWGWDPKETWAFITWVLYAAYLHAGATAGWRGRRAQILAVLGYTAFVFNFFGVNMWITGLHSYAGI